MKENEKVLLNENEKYNRASNLQLFLFSFNNLSTNFPYMVLSSYLLFYAQSYLMLSAVLVGWIMTSMRLFDGITDPFIGFLIDRTDTKFGKFRPWMIVGNIIINVTFIVMFTMIDPAWSTSVKLLVFVAFYIFHIMGYSMQCAITKGGGTVITSDPKQRPILAMYMGAVGIVIVILFMAIIPMMAQQYPQNMLDPDFWNAVAKLTVAGSVICMVLAVAGIWKKDKPENYQGFSNVKINMRDFVKILKENVAIRMLVIAAATDKLAFSMSGAVQVYLYANVLLNQTVQAVMGLISLPLIIIFTLVGTRIGQKYSQKKTFVVATWMSMILSVVCIFFFPKVGAPLSSISVALFLVLYSLRTGLTAVPGNFVVTMVSDCTDYETYLTGKSIPGMMGTLFSFIDKLVSSLNGLIIGLMFAIFGLSNTVIVPLEPASSYPGLVPIIITGLLVLPILGYLASIWSMKRYPLDAEMMNKVKENIALYKENSMDPRHPNNQNSEK